ncbi:MAG: ABC transporter permease [candidate division NC10 bacterium]|nr:ABC transporter permease [candidate division NC10 bacterium]
MFLVYNTMSVSVVRQRRQIGILRALGVSRGQVLLAVAAEGGVIGLMGSALGVALGVGLAKATLGAVSQTVSSLYAFIRPGELHLPATLILQAIVLGCGTAVLSSLLPALEAAAVTPRETLAAASLERRHHPWLLFCAGLGLALAAYGLAQAGPVGGRPLFGYGAALCLLLGATLFCPAVLLVFQRALAAGLAGSRLIPGWMAAGNLGRALRRNAVTIGAMVVSLAMLVSVSTMIQSFRQTVEIWIHQTIRADLYLSRATRLIKGADARLPVGTLDEVRRTPGVAEADGFRGLRIEDGRGGRFLLGAGDFDVMARRGRLLFRGGDSAAILQEARAQDRLIVSETFAERYHVKEGDEVTLHPPGQTIRLRIAGVYYDYTTEGGLAVMDRGLFQRLWRDPWLNSIVIYLQPGADPQAVRHQILQRLPARDDLVVISNQGLKGTGDPQPADRLGLGTDAGDRDPSLGRDHPGRGPAHHPVRGGLHGDAGERPGGGGGASAVAHPDLRHQQAVLRLDDPVHVPGPADRGVWDPDTRGQSGGRVPPRLACIAPSHRRSGAI